MSDAFEALRRFVRTEMRMSHLYQPLSGNLKAFSWLDGASIPTIEIAQKKAYTAQPRVRTCGAARRDSSATCKPASARIRGDSPKLRLLWTANETDAVFDETAISQPMKYIHHLVMPADKRLINSGRFHDGQVECSHDIDPAFSIWDLLNVVASEHHAQRAPREVVGNR